MNRMVLLFNNLFEKIKKHGILGQVNKTNQPTNISISKMNGVTLQEAKKLVMRLAVKVDIDMFLDFQEFVVAKLAKNELWGTYSKRHLGKLMDDGGVIQLYFTDDELVGCMMVWFDSEEELNEHQINHLGLDKTAIYGGVMVSPKYWGNGLQRQMGFEIERIVKERGKTFIVATVSPDNEWSYKNLVDARYVVFSELNMSKGKRLVLIKEL